MEFLFGVVAIGFLVVLVLAIVNESKSTGLFRGLTYLGWVVLWGFYDEVRSFGWKKAILGFSKAEFQAMNQQDWPRSTLDPNVTK